MCICGVKKRKLPARGEVAGREHTNEEERKNSASPLGLIFISERPSCWFIPSLLREVEVKTNMVAL
jgi:hypothetical protein